MKPKILITCGDPNGIGPEIILKIFSNAGLKKDYDLKVIGLYRVFEQYSKKLKIKNLQETDFIELPGFSEYNAKVGYKIRAAGQIAGDAVKYGTILVMKKTFDALVTMPINKASINMANYTYAGHTEMIGDLTDSKCPVMIMYSEEIKVVPLTIHIPLKSVSSVLDTDYLFQQIVTINNTFKNNFKIKEPKLAMLALNPHDGDSGLLGLEEKNILKPLILKIRNKKINIKGTFSADAYFGNKTYKNFDVTLSMYHDQGLIPFKMIAGDKGVNFTGGLNIIRTSPTHGTAFDIAGKGIAKIESSIEAIKLAGKLVKMQK